MIPSCFKLGQTYSKPIKVNSFSDPRSDLDENNRNKDDHHRPKMPDDEDNYENEEHSPDGNYLQAFLSNGNAVISYFLCTNTFMIYSFNINSIDVYQSIYMKHCDNIKERRSPFHLMRVVLHCSRQLSMMPVFLYSTTEKHPGGILLSIVGRSLKPRYYRDISSH